MSDELAFAIALVVTGVLYLAGIAGVVVTIVLTLRFLGVPI